MVNKKTLFVISGAFLLVAAVVACSLAIVGLQKSDDGGDISSGTQPESTTTSVKAIEEFCQPTRYRQTCEDALKKVVGDDTDMKSLVKSSVHVAVDKMKDAVGHSDLLLKDAKDERAAMDLNTCKEVFNYAMEDLNTTLDSIDRYELTQMDKAIDDLKTWVSAVVAYQETCLDSFENTTGETATSMRKTLNSSMEMTSNILAVIDQVSQFIKDFKMPSIMDDGARRRLLAADDSDGLPSWVSTAQRRLMQAQAPWQLNPAVTVAQDGSGQFKTIREGLVAMPKKSEEYVVMHIKAGVYDEQVEVGRNLSYLVMVGDGPNLTKITGRKNVALDQFNTFRTATVAVIGDNFIAKDIAFENTAGPEGHQAVALRVQSDKAVFFNVHVIGYQDTLYALAKRQLYRDSTISGTVDYIFGDGKSYFQNCNLVVRKPMQAQSNIITAHGRKDPLEDTGIVLHNCSVVPAPDLAPVSGDFSTYLARPWKPYSRTLYINSVLDGIVHPDGWMPWMNGTEATNTDTCFYAEIGNRGAGADTSRRVRWKGVKRVEYGKAADEYTLESFIEASEADWLPRTAVPFDANFGASEKARGPGKKAGGH